MDVFAAAVFLALFTEWVTERLFGKVLKGEYMVYLASAIGLALGIGFRIDLLEALNLPTVKLLNYTVSGFIIGGGSSIVHEFKKYLVKP